MSDSQIIITLNGDIAYIRVIGQGTHLNATYLKRSCLNLLAEEVNRFVFDLAECTLLDSTFLGVLLGFALKLKEGGNRSSHLINANAQVFELIKNLGLDRLFNIDPP